LRGREAEETAVEEEQAVEEKEEEDLYLRGEEGGRL